MRSCKTFLVSSVKLIKIDLAGFENKRRNFFCSHGVLRKAYKYTYKKY